MFKAWSLLVAANAEEGGVLTPKQTLIGNSAGTCEAVGIRTPAPCNRLRLERAKRICFVATRVGTAEIRNKEQVKTIG
jgi:hypothetical protein